MTSAPSATARAATLAHQYFATRARPARDGVELAPATGVPTPKAQ